MEKNKLNEVDLVRLIGAVWRRIWIIAIAAVLCAVLAFGYVSLFVSPQYQSSILVYVNNSSISLGGTSLSISSGELVAAQNLVNTYLVILRSHTMLSQIREHCGISYSDAKLSGMIEAAAVNKTEIFRVTVTSADPMEAQQIANTIAEIFPATLSGIVDGSSVKIIDYALLPSGKSAPSITKYTTIGFLLGLIVSCGIVILIEIFNDKVHDENTLTQLFEDIPVLAYIPSLGFSGKGAKPDGYGKYAKFGAYAKYKRPGNAEQVKSEAEHAGETGSDGKGRA